MKITMIAVAALTSSMVMAEATVCKMGEMVRKVEVVHFDKDTTKPCDVQYTKETEMPDSPAATLWHFDVQVDQCQVKAQELISKLQGWGWTCDAAMATPSTETQ